MKPIFFSSPAEWRQWLAAHHDSATEVLVGYYKTSTDKPSLTWQESVDEALCYGWIDGIRKRVDDERYTIRFTPRKPKSNWSAVNIKRVGELIQDGRMQPAGVKAFAARDEAMTQQYSYEARQRGLDETYAKRFTANKKAWAFYQAQAPSYQRAASWWVMSAKQEATRLKRLAALIDDSAHKRRIVSLARTAKPK